MRFCRHLMRAGEACLELLLDDPKGAKAWMLAYEMLKAGIPLKDFPERYKEFTLSEEYFDRYVDLEEEHSTFYVSPEEGRSLFYRDKDVIEYAYLNKDGSLSVSPELPEGVVKYKEISLGPNGPIGISLDVHYSGRPLFLWPVRTPGCPQCAEVIMLEGPQSHFFPINGPEFAALQSLDLGYTGYTDRLRFQWVNRDGKVRLNHSRTVGGKLFYFMNLQRLFMFAKHEISLPFVVGGYEFRCGGGIVYMEKTDKPDSQIRV